MKKIGYSLKGLIIGASFLGISWVSTAQNVGVNATGATPDASAILDISSSDKGMLVPRVTLTGTNDITTIATPATSLLVYNTATVSDVTPGFYYFNGTLWVRIASGSTVGTDNQTLALSGNDLSISNGNTITLTDNVNDADSNATNEIQNLSISGNTVSLSRGGGSVTLPSGTDDQNISGSGLSGTNLTIGIEGGSNQTVNLAPLKDHDWYEVGGTTQPNSINDNIFTQGRVGIGIINPMGGLNIKGIDAGSNSLGDGASLVLGDVSGSHLEIDNNEIVAMNANADTGSLYIAARNIGINTNPVGSNTSVRRMSIYPTGNVAIGAHTPTEKLHVVGSVRIEDGTQGAGKVLTSDANGKGSWQAPSTSLLLPVSYPYGTDEPNTTFSGSTGVNTVATFTAPSAGLYMVCTVVTVNIKGGQFGDLSNFQSNSQTYVSLTGGGSSAREEHLTEDNTKQFSLSYLYNLTAGQVVSFKIGQQNATSFGFSGLEMRVVKF